MTDAEIIVQVLDGHRDAYSGIVDRHYADCGRFAYRMLGNRQDAEDALQETFLRAYRALATYRHSDRFRSWLFRILVNQCRTTARRRRRYTARFDSATEDDLGARGQIDPSERVVEARDLLDKLLDPLDPALPE